MTPPGSAYRPGTDRGPVGHAVGAPAEAGRVSAGCAVTRTAAGFDDPVRVLGGAPSRRTRRGRTAREPRRRGRPGRPGRPDRRDRRGGPRGRTCPQPLAQALRSRHQEARHGRWGSATATAATFADSDSDSDSEACAASATPAASAAKRRMTSATAIAPGASGSISV